MMAAAAALVLAAGCAPRPRVRVEPDATADLSKYRTFQIVQDRVVEGGGVDLNQARLRARVRERIANELVAKGLRQVETDPDVRVRFTANVSRDAGRAADVDDDAVTWDRQVGPIDRPGALPRRDSPAAGPGGGGDEGTLAAAPQTRGSLVIDLNDARTGALVWRAFADADVTAAAGDEQVDAAIAEAFRAYPQAVGSRQ